MDTFFLVWATPGIVNSARHKRIMLKLPGLIDAHVHMRDPGQTHKEDWGTGTSAALAGGVTMVMAMPNTKPPVFDAATLDSALESARGKAFCDYAQFLGAGPENTDWGKQPDLPGRTAGLKMYLDQTFGELRLDSLGILQDHFRNWPANLPIVAHSEGRSLATVILLAALYDRSVHVAHVSLKEEILLIKAAKERGIQVTCEVTPHHLFLIDDDLPTITRGHPGRGEVRPRLATREDSQALWDNLDVIDCIATDHAPHTLAEKDGENPPPGFPGLETALPLLLTAIHEKRLTVDALLEKMVTNPCQIFNLPEQKETWVEVDDKAEYDIHADELFSRCGWTPFESWKVRGRVRRVMLRGQEAYKDGKILVEPGYGKNCRI
jgi:carbamoyl-phosphate synthase / aspartate carbamoyltransferase / dihydroorotase